MKYIPFIFIIFVIACEQVVDIEVPEHDAQLVLSSFYETGDSEVIAYLTKSLPINSNEDVHEVLDATAKLYENDVLLEQFLSEPDTVGYNFAGWNDSLNMPILEPEIQPVYKLDLTAPLQADKTYKITVEAPGFESASANQRLPLPPEINEVNYKPMSRTSVDGYLMDAFEIKLSDVPDEDNYYEFDIYRSWDNSGNPNEWDRMWTESLSPGTEQGDRGVLLKDDLFENGSYSIEVLVWPEDTSYVDFKVEVKSISRDKYLFSKSLNAYYNAQDNPFAEPVIIHTNVENGQGIFSMENKSEFIIE